jgi:hypothetical protein
MGIGNGEGEREGKGGGVMNFCVEGKRKRQRRMNTYIEKIEKNGKMKSTYLTNHAK